MAVVVNPGLDRSGRLRRMKTDDSLAELSCPEEEHRSWGPPCWHERHQAEADGDPEEGLQEPGGEGTHHIAHDKDHHVRTTFHIPVRNREEEFIHSLPIAYPIYGEPVPI
ncbi:hypothetical protein QTP86_000927 [Hemibagrus guttatus]|nr:hypothetical protein QTP86_000927 [Hemibagrus guttatus]